MELAFDFKSLAEWNSFRDSDPSLHDDSAFRKLGDAIQANGCREPLTGTMIPGHDLEPGSSLREGLVFQGINSRVRGVMLAIEEVIRNSGLASPRIYAAEGLTPFALRMRGMFPRFLGSEYAVDAQQIDWLYPIPCEDLQALTLPSETFDVVSTNEVLEHVPSIDRSLAEICRVLKPGGWHIGTVPFRFFDQQSQVKAILGTDGKIIHLMEPEFHGDPMSDKGVLVFEVPGWDILTRAKKAGFRQAFMRFVISRQHGVVADHVGGVFILCCEK